MLTTVKFALVLAVIVSCESAIIQAPQVAPQSPVDKKDSPSIQNNKTVV